MPAQYQDPSQSHVALHILVSQLTQAVLPAANSRQNTLVNDVDPCLLVLTNPSGLAVVIRQLLDTINNNSENSFIRLSARISGDVLLIHIRKKSADDAGAIAQCLAPLRKLAEELFGSVSITSQRNEVITLALSFINQAATA